MSFYSKEDQLLEKLQKCVGKLETKEPVNDRIRPHHDFNRYSANTYMNYSVSQGKNMEQKFERNNYDLENVRPSYNSKNKLEGFGLNWGGNVKEKFDKSFESARVAFNYVPGGRQRENQPIYSEREGEIKKRFQSRNNFQQNKRQQGYKIQYTSQKRPLQEHSLNINISNLNLEEPKQKSTFLYEQKQRRQPQAYQNSASKYDEYYKKPERKYSINTDRRNSLLQDENLRKVQQRQKEKEREQSKIQRQRLLQMSGRLQKYNSKNIEKADGVKPFSYSSSMVDQQKLEQGISNSRIKQITSRNRSRNASIGSITSIHKRVPIQSKPTVSYQTFQPRQQRQLNLKQILDEVSNANEDTFTKLQKISELNERINMRIKNIINTFESK